MCLRGSYIHGLVLLPTRERLASSGVCLPRQLPMVPLHPMDGLAHIASTQLATSLLGIVTPAPAAWLAIYSPGCAMLPECLLNPSFTSVFSTACDLLQLSLGQCDVGTVPHEFLFAVLWVVLLVILWAAVFVSLVFVLKTSAWYSTHHCHGNKLH